MRISVYCGCERSHYSVWPPGVADGKRISNTKDPVGGSINIIKTTSLVREVESPSPVTLKPVSLCRLTTSMLGDLFIEQILTQASDTDLCFHLLTR